MIRCMKTCALTSAENLQIVVEAEATADDAERWHGVIVVTNLDTSLETVAQKATIVVVIVITAATTAVVIVITVTHVAHVSIKETVATMTMVMVINSMVINSMVTISMVDRSSTAISSTLLDQTKSSQKTSRITIFRACSRL